MENINSISKKITIGDSLHVYGSLGRGIDYTVRLALRLRDEVDEDMLREALNKTEKRYPYFSVHLSKNDTEYYYEENPAPISLLHTDRQISLNSPESNGHVWAVCYQGDRLFLDFFHGIADGTGMYMVLATLLYYYCNARYGVTDHEGIRTLEDPILPEETVDPLDLLPVVDLTKLPQQTREPAFLIADDGGAKPCASTITDIEIPESAFVRFSSASDASPGTMVSLLLTRAIDARYPQREKIIRGGYVVNGRPMMHAPKSHHNCVTMVRYDYSERLKNMPFETQCTALRGITFVQSDEEYVQKAMTFISSRNRAILAMPGSVEEKTKTFGRMIEVGRLFTTQIVSYVGQWKQKAVGAYIEEFWTHVPSANDFTTEISAINGKIGLSIHQTFEDDKLMNLFFRQLEENGIPYTLKAKMMSDVAFFQKP
ncbi:MAG: hypothetical protein IKF90_21795 [Parasporobacterium sp.]|nr:hypothetical protein [Parasporobacterium sp.]